MATVNEKSTAFLTVTFRNRDGKKQTPSAYYYRIDTSLDDEILGWVTQSNPGGSSFEIRLSSSYHDFRDERFDTQQNIVTVEADFANNQKKTDTFSYNIKNLRKQ